MGLRQLIPEQNIHNWFITDFFIGGILNAEMVNILLCSSLLLLIKPYVIVPALFFNFNMVYRKCRKVFGF